MYLENQNANFFTYIYVVYEKVFFKIFSKIFCRVVLVLNFFGKNIRNIIIPILHPNQRIRGRNFSIF